mmetsp:Transcript_24518/g.97283  ORF Transcript_24518/g.97283 Transcript_24518/m.97283 type:complete len:660 (-) Transcript_24518:54-2033(-)
METRFAKFLERYTRRFRHRAASSSSSGAGDQTTTTSGQPQQDETGASSSSRSPSSSSGTTTTTATGGLSREQQFLVDRHAALAAKLDAQAPSPTDDAREDGSSTPEPCGAHTNHKKVVVCSRAAWRARRDALADWRPARIVLVDAEPEFVREVECYRARRRGAVAVYVLVCDASADAAAYGVALDAETTAFERLVQDKETMLVPKSARREALKRGVDDGTTTTTTLLGAAASTTAAPSPSETTAARHRGGGVPPRADQAAPAPATIVVDAREFRSRLPGALYARGVALRPATLAVGDYVLAPDLVVERKSLADLVGSLQSGRLASQAEAMQRAYQTPVLLVETTGTFFKARAYAKAASSSGGASSSSFGRGGRRPKKPRRAPHGENSGAANGVADDDDAAGASSLRGPVVDDDDDPFGGSDDPLYDDDLATPASTEARVAILAMAFPRLRVVWCRDDHAAVALFAALKKGRRQPELLTDKADSGSSSARGASADAAHGGRNVVAIDLLLKLPGVTEKNVHELVEKVDNLRELVSMSRADLAGIIGAVNARRLHEFLHYVDEASGVTPPEHVTSVLTEEVDATANSNSGAKKKPGKKPGRRTAAGAAVKGARRSNKPPGGPSATADSAGGSSGAEPPTRRPSAAATASPFFAALDVSSAE